ncbi:MAG TPA: electron transfer flavoprotein subunit alpha/FixB family protein, partial [Candidatus Dormibacteraeota bacterium]
PLVATLRPGSRGAPRPRPRPLEVELLPAGEPRVRRLRRLQPDPRSVRLAEAERIVAAGLGIGSSDRLPAVQELADLLGAALGASRPLADRGWVPFERQIGTTGQQVAPRLYVAVGISGASQHLGGIREAETIVAINTDPACPMMARATLAAVGDAGEVVEALAAALRAREAPV